MTTTANQQNQVQLGDQAERLPFDLARIRRDFPVLQRDVAPGVKLVYLDNAATSQRPVQVLATLTRYYRDHNSNIHRGVHTLSVESTEMYEEARSKVARFINAPNAHGVVFLRNTTEAINLVAHSWGRKFLQEGDEVLLTEIEHHSNIVPWQLLREERGIVLKFIPMLPDGTLDLEAGREMITERTKLLGITAVSNALGTIVPLEEIVPHAKAQGVRVLVDGAQLVPHMPVDVQALDIDFLAFSGHKMLAPFGIGALWGRLDLLNEMEPFLGGGSMISKVTFEQSTWAEVPEKFEAGTPDVGGAIALGAAVDYLSALGMDRVREHERELTEYALNRLDDVPGLRIFGPPSAEQRCGVIAFELADVHPHDIGQVLDARGVAIRTGHHCAQPVMAALNVPATARASFYLYNTQEEIDALADGLSEVVKFFGVDR